MEMDLYLLIVTLPILISLCYILIKKKPNKTIMDKNVVITGGSSGIGLCIAIECVKRGAKSITIIARNIEALENAHFQLELYRLNANQKIQYKSLDISKDYSNIVTTFDEIEAIQEGEIDILVNCAGMAICGIIEDVSINDAKNLMDVNYFGTYYCTRYVLPKMKKAKNGIIIITASQAALMGIYGYGAYTVAKFALRGLAETISMESRHLGVSVTLALPSDTNTPGFENEEKSKPIETKIISSSGGLADPEEVAKKILQDALEGSFISILGFESWILTLLCCGMAPWGGILLKMFQVSVMGPLRLLGCILQWNFTRVIKNCSQEKQIEKKNE